MKRATGKHIWLYIAVDSTPTLFRSLVSFLLVLEGRVSHLPCESEAGQFLDYVSRYAILELIISLLGKWDSRTAAPLVLSFVPIPSFSRGTSTT